MTQLRAAAHTSRSWRIAEVAADFDVEDVWCFDTPGMQADFPRFVEVVCASLAPTGRRSLLMTIRLKLGASLGWDRPEDGLGARVAPLRDSLPPDLLLAREFCSADPRNPFSPMYQLENEWAAELANATTHGVLHLGWVEAPAGVFRGQMAVLVRPNGWRGRFYLAAIKPVRRLVIYPIWIRRIEKAWVTWPG